jgi:hypothetical protein
MNEGYNGNPLIKKSGVSINWTPELVEEFLKCSKDPIYFSENYIKIVHVDRGFIPIELYDYQKEIIEAITDYKRVVVNSGRQQGKTTTAVCLILHYILFNEYKLVALLANKGDTAREILSRVKLAYEALPNWLQQGIIEWNKGSIELENGCKVIAAATSSSAIRGKSVSLLYLDEASFVENWAEFFASVFPTISSGETTKILLTSTPNHMNHFYKICEGAREVTEGSREGVNGYVYIEVPWHRVPGRTEKWKQETLAAMNFDEGQFEQEFNCSFQGKSGTLIDNTKLKLLKFNRPIKEEQNVHIFEEPINNHVYAMAVDTSRGVGLDYSAFVVIDVTDLPYKVVATFKDNFIQPLLYPTLIANVGNWYNEAMICVEINDNGQQIVDILHGDLEYGNVVITNFTGRKGTRMGSSGKVSRLGVRTTKSVKRIGTLNLKTLIESNKIIVNDFRIIDELATFILKGSSYEAESGTHDDLVMCLVIFAWMANQRYFKDLTDIDVRTALLYENERMIESMLTPFGLIDDGQAYHNNDEVITVSNFDRFMLD